MNTRFVLLALAAFAGGIIHVAQPIALHSENPYYFLWRGNPTVLVSSAEHYGAVINLDFDDQRYLEALARDGMNYTRLFVEND